MNELMRKLLFLPEQASTVAREIDGLHYFVIGVTLVGWATVTLVGTYFAARYRRRSENQVTASVHFSMRFEALLIGGTLTLFLVWWLIGFEQYVGMRAPPKDAMDVYVTGKQWMWKFAYPDGRSSIAVLTVPQGRPVRLIMTSRDVIHSFYVPAFRIKQDVLPGRYTETWFEAKKPGVYQVFCTEYCGLWHSDMLGRVVVLSPKDYADWLRNTEPVETPRVIQVADPRATTVSLAENGRQVAARYGCFGCHTIDGRPHIGPSWRSLYGSQVALEGGQKALADEAYLTRSMMDPRVEIVRGYPSVMPSYVGILSPTDVASLVELIKSLRERGPTPVVPVWEGAPKESEAR